MSALSLIRKAIPPVSFLSLMFFCTLQPELVHKTDKHVLAGAKELQLRPGGQCILTLAFISILYLRNSSESIVEEDSAVD
jgi:hypothetical protein